MTPELLTAALAYADLGWSVFPLLPGSKRPACPGHPAARCDRSDPYCRHGHTGWEQRATTNRKRITRAWSSRPYGIGIATGPSGLLILDTDIPKPGEPIPAPWTGRQVDHGDNVLAEVASQHRAQLPATYTVGTPSGGRHRYYRQPADVELGNTAGRLGWLVDTRGHGGYVVAAPTLIGRSYTVTHNRTPAALPHWLTQLLDSPIPPTPSPPHSRQRRGQGAAAGQPGSGYAAAALTGEAAHVRAALPGQRNHTLFCAAVALGQLVAGGLVDETTARNALRDACAEHIAAAAFTEADADATITSGLNRGAGQPRTRTARRNAA